MLDHRRDIGAPWTVEELEDSLDRFEGDAGLPSPSPRNTSARTTSAHVRRNFLEEGAYLPTPTRETQPAQQARTKQPTTVFVPTNRRVSSGERRAILAASPKYELDAPDLAKRRELEEAYEIVTGSPVTSPSMSNLLAASWRVHGEDTRALLLDLFEEIPTTTNLLLRLRAAHPRKAAPK